MQHETPLVSVVVPCFRAVKTLPMTVESVLSQSFGDYELILVDDGSPDETLALCHSLASRDPRIRVIAKANGGVSSARNRGVGVSRGSIIAFLDADDIWMPEKLAEHVALHAAQPKAGVSYARIRFLDPEAAPLHVTSRISTKPVSTLRLLAENVACTTSNLVVRREVFDAVGGFDEALDFDEDKEWLLRAHLAGVTFIPIDSVLTGYRTSPQGLASDPAKMEAEWTRYVDAVARTSPDAVSGVRAQAEAVFLRNLARRIIRLGGPGRAALRTFLRALLTDPRALAIEPRRWIMTGIAALAIAAIPERLAARLARRLDRLPSRLETQSTGNLPI